MNTIASPGIRRLAAGLICAFAAVAATAASSAEPRATPQAVIRSWPVSTRAAAAAMLEKYGRPSQFDRRALVWFNNGVWKRTIVYRHGLRRSPNGRERDFLQQTIAYLVPAGKAAELKRFSPRLEVSPAAGELTVVSDGEGSNLLALNLADEIVVGKRSAEQARAFFARSARLAASGKSSPYLEGLRFHVDNTRYMSPGGADQ